MSTRTHRSVDDAWYTTFGNHMTAREVADAARDAGMTVAAWFAQQYGEIYDADQRERREDADDAPDFDDFARQIEDELEQ